MTEKKANAKAKAKCRDLSTAPRKKPRGSGRDDRAVGGGKPIELEQLHQAGWR
jgi:hypothetical protein